MATLAPKPWRHFCVLIINFPFLLELSLSGVAEAPLSSLLRQFSLAPSGAHERRDAPAPSSPRVHCLLGAESGLYTFKTLGQDRGIQGRGRKGRAAVKST